MLKVLDGMNDISLASPQPWQGLVTTELTTPPHTESDTIYYSTETSTEPLGRRTLSVT